MSGRIRIRTGDIEKIETECIVNAANSGLRCGTGVCGAVFAGAGAAAMQEACDRIGHCGTGDAVVTEAFALPARWVIHAVGPHTSERDAEARLRSAYRRALDRVREKGCRRVSFPLISSGVFNDAGMSYESLWKIAVSAVLDFQSEHPDEEIDVLFVCHGDHVAKAGEKVLAAALDRDREDREKTIRRCRIWTAGKGGFRDSSNYQYIAEFEDRKLSEHYVKYMRGKKRYADKDIIIQEIWVKSGPEGETAVKGKVIGVISCLGESLPVEEYEFR